MKYNKERQRAWYLVVKRRVPRTNVQSIVLGKHGIWKEEE
jgi:hypothetical protein